MRLIGNKTHGDLAEIAIAEFVNQYMYDFRSIHVGKDLYRAKSKEEDITIKNEITKAKFPVSLKAYGDGPLQLSTDKNSLMFRTLSEAGPLDEPQQIKAVFDYDTARAQTAKIIRRSEGKGRKHPVFVFLDAQGNYICEVRYGDAATNALQRGLWTHTRNALKHFDSIPGDGLITLTISSS